MVPFWDRISRCSPLCRKPLAFQKLKAFASKSQLFYHMPLCSAKYYQPVLLLSKFHYIIAQSNAHYKVLLKNVKLFLYRNWNLFSTEKSGIYWTQAICEILISFHKSLQKPSFSVLTVRAQSTLWLSKAFPVLQQVTFTSISHWCR